MKNFLKVIIKFFLLQPPQRMDNCQKLTHIVSPTSQRSEMKSLLTVFSRSGLPMQTTTERGIIYVTMMLNGNQA